MPTVAYTQVDGRPYQSPKTHRGRAPYTLADNGDGFVALAKEFHGKVIAEYAARAKMQKDNGLPVEEHIIELIVDNKVVDPETV